MVGDVNRGIQVLNISNVNALGKTVLNDGKLLELVQKYPFLYNPRVKAYNDNDYVVWAWKNINAAFNRSYLNDPSAAFSTDDLISRWNVLKPLIQCLSKAYDMEAIPHSLRQSVVRISAELDNQNSNPLVKSNNSCQNLLMKNMESISELPMEEKLALERDILEFILSSELESKQTTNLDEKAWKEVEQDTDELLNDIGFKQVLRSTVNYPEQIFYNNNSNKHNSKDDMRRPKRSLCWIPLKDVHYFIKPCSVRIKRINIEEYLPLAQIIKLNKKRRSNSEYLSGKLAHSIFGL